MRRECLGERFGAVRRRAQTSALRWYSASASTVAGPIAASWQSPKRAQVVAECEQAAEKVFDAVAAGKDEPIEVGEPRRSRRRPATNRRAARFRSPAGRARRRREPRSLRPHRVGLVGGPRDEHRLAEQRPRREPVCERALAGDRRRRSRPPAGAVCRGPSVRRRSPSVVKIVC